MSILSTNTKLVKVGKDYSAGENIGIYDYTISSRNWSPDITYAAESAFQRATGYTEAQISALSGKVSDEVSQLGSDIQYISGVALTAHQSLEGYLTKASGDEYYQPIGSYATVSQLESTSGEIVNLIPTDYVSNETLEQTSGNIVNLIPDTSEFITNASAEQTYQPIGNYLSSNALEGYATQDWVGEQGYITGVDLSNYYTKNETSGADELEQAFANIPLGDEEVNELVHSNSGEWNNVSAKLDTTAYTPFDPSYMSGAIDEKLDTTAFSTVSGDFLTAIPDEYATKDFVSNSITGKLDISSFSSVSGDFLTNEDLNGYATETFVQDTSANITALIPTDYYPDTNPSGFITGVDLSNYYTKTDTSSKEEISAAIASIPLGDEEVNQAVHTNSATWNTVSDKLDTTAFSDVSSTFLTAHQSLDGYATEQFVENVSADITALIPTDYATNTQINELSGAIDYVSANAGDQEVHNIVHTNSATWDSVTNKLDTTAFSDVSGTFLTAHQSLDGYATETLVEETSGAITSLIPTNYYPDTNPSGFISGVDLRPYATTAEVDTLSSMLSGAIDYVSANAGDEFPASANDAITAYQTNSATYLTAHQAISADEWNDCYDNVNTNSGAWGGDALPITGRDGIDLEIDNGTLYIGASALTGSIDYIQTNSANIGEVVTNYQTASGTYLTAVDLSPYATTNELEQVSADITATIPSTAGLASESYVQTNSAVLTAMIDGKQDTLTFGYDEQDRINSINSSALAGGGGVPQSAFDELKQSYDAISSIIAICSGQWFPKYTAEYAGNAAANISYSTISNSIELQPNTFNIQYSAHYELAQANRYNCLIGLYKSTEPNESEYVYSASYSAVSEDTKIVDISGTLEVDTSIGYDRFYPLRDTGNVFGNVTATITAQCYV